MYLYILSAPLGSIYWAQEPALLHKARESLVLGMDTGKGLLQTVDGTDFTILNKQIAGLFYYQRCPDKE
jgi:hypothetical protein